MLQVTIPETETYDASRNLFFYTKKTTLLLEHSLVSVSKWESKWNKPFLSRDEKTLEECRDYVRCMTITQNVDPSIYECLSEQIFEEITDYIKLPMTATTFSKQVGKAPSREIITAEIIYYWMIALQIPLECEKWHLNRLLTLIKVCDLKSQDSKKIPKKDLLNRNRALNAARRQALNTRG